ncbi:MAG: hypothetical protein U9P63_00800 [Patescibacteria group bacterium]|nr:hypothetical protein [Patescibacteria group bacterium]
MDKIGTLKKYLLTCALGFGLGGLLWGAVLYSELPDLEYPFHFMAILIMGLFGGISLTLFSKSVKKISKAVLVGFLGWGVGFVVTAIFQYPLYLYSVYSLITPIEPIISADMPIKEFVNLFPNINIGFFWLFFLIIGAIVGFLYSFFFKLKKWPLIWRGGVGFALGSLVGPVIGNLTGNLFNSLLISYLLTFSLMGAIFGLFLSWGVYKHQKG